MATRTLFRGFYSRLPRFALVILAAGMMLTLGSLGENRVALAFITNAGLSCSGSVNGQEVQREDKGTIEVSLHTQVGTTMTVAGQTQLSRARVYLSFAEGLSVLVSDTVNPSNPYQSSVSVDQYASHGVGIYRLNVTLDDTSGKSCDGSTFIDVKGDPLQTDAGRVAAAGEGVALAGTLLGLGAAAGSGEGGTRTPSDPYPGENPYTGEDNPYTGVDERDLRGTVEMLSGGACFFLALPGLLLTGLAMASPGAGPGATPPRVIYRHGWRPRLSFVALLSGLIGTLSTVVLLQQYGVAFPTYKVIGAVAVAWLLVAILLPSLGRKIAVNRANRREIRAEQARAAAAPRV